MSIVFSWTFSQQSDYKAGRYYLQPLEKFTEEQIIEAYNEAFDVYEERKICRETVWERKIHEGFVWVPNHADGTWYTIEKDRGYFWTFHWTDWKFCDGKE